MLEACQLPQNIIEAMSTEDLIQTLMNHPLFLIYTAYNNELDGVNVILDNFNGFSTLQKRADIAEKLIDYYATIDVSEMVEAIRKSSLTKDLTIFHLDFLELIMATKKIPEIFSEQNIGKLEFVMNEKYEAKLNHVNDISLSSIRKSLILGAEIKLSHSSLDIANREILQNFIKAGVGVTLDEYTHISKIIFLK